jgi:hypothetical protein
MLPLPTGNLIEVIMSLGGGHAGAPSSSASVGGLVMTAQRQEASMTPEEKAKFIALFSGPRQLGRNRFGGRLMISSSTRMKASASCPTPSRRDGSDIR